MGSCYNFSIISGVQEYGPSNTKNTRGNWEGFGFLDIG